MCSRHISTINVAGGDGYLRQGAHALVGQNGGNLAIGGANLISSGGALAAGSIVKETTKNIPRFGPAFQMQGAKILNKPTQIGLASETVSAGFTVFDTGKRIYGNSCGR